MEPMADPIPIDPIPEKIPDQIIKTNTPKIPRQKPTQTRSDRKFTIDDLYLQSLRRCLRDGKSIYKKTALKYESASEYIAQLQTIFDDLEKFMKKKAKKTN